MAEGNVSNFRPIMVEGKEITTDADGFVNFSFSDSNPHIVISCWSVSADTLCLTFPSASGGFDGRFQWWAKLLNVNTMQPRANYSTTIYYAYI